MYNKTILIVIISILIMIPNTGYSQVVVKDPAVIPLNGETGYSKRSDNMWEGMCYDQHSNSIKILSLTFDEISYEIEEEVILYISTPVPTSSSVKVRGASINPGLSYQMDTIVTPFEKKIRFELI